MSRIVTFGEIMLRLAPEGFYRLAQVLPGSLDATFGGAEANVAVSLCRLGKQASFISALPDNTIGDACLASLKAHGVDTSNVVKCKGGRLGVYFLETGANQRPSQVVYDRDGSCISTTNAADYNWAAALKDAGWFHTTGITPAISSTSAQAALEGLKQAKQAGVTTSCDLNFRKKLWKWDKSLSPNALAQKTMRTMLPYVDVVIANEEDAADVLGIRAKGSDVHSGKLDVAAYVDVARQIVGQFPNVSKVAITLRQSISATHNNWGGMLYDAGANEAFFAPLDAAGNYKPYEIRNIVDRVGGGDSFGAALIYALTTSGLENCQSAIAFASAGSCLAHSIVGDFNYTSRSEVEALMKGSGSGRVVR